MKKVLAVLLMLCMVLSVANINLIRANPFGPPNVMSIYIKSDGSIEPANSPIRNAGSNQYVLTDNLSPPSNSLYNSSMYNIVIEKDHISLDGANHTIDGLDYGVGIEILSRNNVTIKNIVLSQFETGIEVYQSSNVNIFDNSISANQFGIQLSNSSNVVIAENNFSNYSYQTTIDMMSSNSTIIYGNNLSCTPVNGWLANGLRLEYCSNNYIVANTITNFYAGINLLNSSNNYFFQNNFVGNKIQAQDLLTLKSYQTINDNNKQFNERVPPKAQFYIYQFSTNAWNNNYWSDYNSTSNDNGVGELPYTIDARNVDNSPLTQKVTLEQAVPLNSIHSTIDMPANAPLTANSPTSTPSPTPTVPEFPLLAIIPIMIGVLSLAVIIKIRSRKFD